MRAPVTFSLVMVLFSAGCDFGAARRAEIELEKAQIAQARALVRRIAEELDQRTNEAGVFLRVEDDEIQDTDPWGTKIAVSYSQGGVAEMVHVRSAGPDREFHTDDDVVESGMAANMKGIGEGIKQNAEETAANAAKGAVKGAVDGVKESIKESLPFGKKKGDEAEPQPEEEAPQNDESAEQG